MKRGIDMFKRIMFMMMFALILSVTMNTSVTSASPQTDLLSKYVDMRLSLDVGINRADYQRLYRELYIATKKSESQMPTEDYVMFNKAFVVYGDIATAWNAYGLVFYQRDFKNMFGDRYPEITSRVRCDLFGKYDKESILVFLFKQSDEPAKALEKYFADKAKETHETTKTPE